MAMFEWFAAVIIIIALAMFEWFAAVICIIAAIILFRLFRANFSSPPRFPLARCHSFPDQCDPSSNNTSVATFMSSDSPLLWESATSLAARIRNREFTSVQLVELFIAQILRVNPHINAAVACVIVIRVFECIAAATGFFFSSPL
jgi:hypothetical protein